MPKQTRFITQPKRDKPTAPPAKHSNVSVIILGGSLGYRMKSYGPKSLLKLSDGQTILEKQVVAINQCFDNPEIILTIGEKADKVIKKRPHNIHLIENELYNITNNAAETRLGINACTNRKILIIDAGVIFNHHAITDIMDRSSIIISDKYIQESEVGVTVIDGMASIFSYELHTKWCKIVSLIGKELDLFRKFINNRDRSKHFMFEIMNDVINSGGKFVALCPEKMKIKNIHSIEDLHNVL